MRRIGLLSLSMLIVLLFLACPGTILAQEGEGALDVAFVTDVTIPDDTALEPEESFEKVWRLKNSGSSDWAKDFSLIFAEGDQLPAADSQLLGEKVAPGETVDIGVVMQAPAEDGVYTSWWRMQDNDGNVFGQKVYVRIVVGNPPQAPPFSPIEVDDTIGDGPVLRRICQDCADDQYQYIVWCRPGAIVGPKGIDLGVQLRVIADKLFVLKPGGKTYYLVAFRVNDKPHVGFVRTNIVRLKGGIDTSHWARQEASELSAGEAFVSSVPIDLAYVSDGRLHLMNISRDASVWVTIPFDQAYRVGMVDWSPDGTKLTFNMIIAIEEKGATSICTANPDGSDFSCLMEHAPHVSNMSPKWSPDGQQIMFVSTRQHETGRTNFQLYAMNADGSNQHNIVNTPTMENAGDWSPDGSQIVFPTDRWGNCLEICTMNLNSGEVTRLTDSPEWDVRPVWSPDGSRIAFSSDRSGDFEIYVMNADGSNLVQLTSVPGADECPSWSSEGNQIAFHGDRDGNQDIYIMDADGSNLVNVTNSPTEDRYPSWRP